MNTPNKLYKILKENWEKMPKVHKYYDSADQILNLSIDSFIEELTAEEINKVGNKSSDNMYEIKVNAQIRGGYVNEITGRTFESDDDYLGIQISIETESTPKVFEFKSSDELLNMFPSLGKKILDILGRANY